MKKYTVEEIQSKLSYNCGDDIYTLQAEVSALQLVVSKLLKILQDNKKVSDNIEGILNEFKTEI